MFNILPITLILAAFTTIIVIVVRKFSVLANLDVETIQAEREAKVREQIIGNRIKRGVYKHFNRLARLLRPLFQFLGKGGKALYDKLVDFKDSYNQEVEPLEEKLDNMVKKMHDAEELIREDKFAEAENILIEIIGLDPKNIDAFRNLGKVYLELKNYGEARQTYEHAIKLLEKLIDSSEQNTQVAGADSAVNEEAEKSKNHLALLYFDLSQVLAQSEQAEEGLKILKKALKLEPNNPRYLDTMFEISIIIKDKASALEAYEKLKEVNPENQKLAGLKTQIDEL